MGRTRDDRPIGVALEEADDHLVPGPRDELRPPALSRPDLRDPHPARALDLAVPVELDSHAAILVGGDFRILELVLAVGDHDRGLRALDQRFRSRSRRTELLLEVDGLDRETEARAIRRIPGLVGVR